MKRTIVLSFAYVVLLMAQTVYGQLVNASVALTPPAGNSPGKVVKTVNSYHVYTCKNGTWVRGEEFATLMDSTTNKMVGNYSRVFDKHGELGTWTLNNSIGDSIESGASASAVTGRPVASSVVGKDDMLPSQLFEAASHQNAGAAASVSYIQKYNIVGGLPPPRTCLTRVYSVRVPMTAEFCLWTQDPTPASVPANLVSPGRLVEGFFGAGHINYEYIGSGWVDCGKTGTLYTLPGTPVIGTFWDQNGVQGWKMYDPNGFIIYGKLVSPEVKVDVNAVPWSLSSVTSESGSSTSLGAFSHVQMTSTRGGLPPTFTPLYASGVWRVPFSAIFWFYVSG